MRCCVEDEGLWPFGVALRGEASNRLMLRWLKTVVVSDEEKAHWMRQVGTGKASESEPLSLQDLEPDVVGDLFFRLR